MSELSDPPTLLKSEAVQLSLIGMSGAGKSYWSKRMESLGFQMYSCDDLIAERLGQKLEEKGKSTINLAKWMGQPFSEGYRRQKLFILNLKAPLSLRSAMSWKTAVKKISKLLLTQPEV